MESYPSLVPCTRAKSDRCGKHSSICIACVIVFPRPLYPLCYLYRTGHYIGLMLTAFSVMDLEMMTIFNSKEREIGDWQAIFQRADPRLEIRRVVKPPGSVNSIIEVALKEGE